MNPLLTVGVINYNQGEYIAQCLDNILNQTFQNFELFIIDDLSTDNSRQLIQDYIDQHKVNCTFIKNEVNQGICKNLNQLLERSSCKYFTFIAADDWGTANRFEDMVNILEQSSGDVATVYSDCSLVDEKGVLISGSYIKYFRPDLDPLKPPSGMIFMDLLNYNFIPAMATVTRTEVLKEVGGFDENLKFEDYDLWLKIAHKYQIIFSGKSTCFYRILANSLIRRLGARKWEDMIRIYLKYSNQNSQIDALILPKIFKSLENVYFEDSTRYKEFYQLVVQKFSPDVKTKLLFLFHSIGLKGSFVKNVSNVIQRRK